MPFTLYSVNEQYIRKLDEEASGLLSGLQGIKKNRPFIRVPITVTNSENKLETINFFVPLTSYDKSRDLVMNGQPFIFQIKNEKNETISWLHTRFMFPEKEGTYTVREPSPNKTRYEHEKAEIAYLNANEEAIIKTVQKCYDSVCDERVSSSDVLQKIALYPKYNQLVEAAKKYTAKSSSVSKLNKTDHAGNISPYSVNYTDKLAMNLDENKTTFDFEDEFPALETKQKTSKQAQGKSYSEAASSGLKSTETKKSPQMDFKKAIGTSKDKKNQSQ